MKKKTERIKKWIFMGWWNRRLMDKKKNKPVDATRSGSKRSKISWYNFSFILSRYKCSSYRVSCFLYIGRKKQFVFRYFMITLQIFFIKNTISNKLIFSTYKKFHLIIVFFEFFDTIKGCCSSIYFIISSIYSISSSHLVCLL